MTIIHIVPILRDNYCYIVEGSDKKCVIIDPGQTRPVISAIKDHGLTPVLILNTHHHADHVAGNKELKGEYGIDVLGPEAEMASIPNIDKGIKPGTVIVRAGLGFKVLSTPGHTNGHVSFYEEASKSLFCGDVIFSMGCGRLMEGTATDMWNSLQTLKSLPQDTNIYGGHEYTEANGRFALHLLPENDAIKARMKEIGILRGNDLPTFPTTLAQELMTNPFLMARNVEDFAYFREQKDNF